MGHNCYYTVLLGLFTALLYNLTVVLYAAAFSAWGYGFYLLHIKWKNQLFIGLFLHKRPISVQGKHLYHSFESRVVCSVTWLVYDHILLVSTALVLPMLFFVWKQINEMLLFIRMFQQLREHWSCSGGFTKTALCVFFFSLICHPYVIIIYTHSKAINLLLYRWTNLFPMYLFLNLFLLRSSFV